MICVFTKSRTVLEYRLSDLSFQRSYSIDLNSIPFYFNPAIAHVPEESSSLFFHKHPTQPDRFMLQRRNYSGFTIQSSILPFDYSFTYDIPTYDVLKSGTGEIFTGVTTMLNTSIGLGGSDIIITKYSSSLQRISSLVFSTIKNDNMSNIFLSGNDSVLVVGMTEGVLHIPTAETARQIFVAQMLYSDISAVSTSAPNVIMANEMISISFSSVLPSAAYQSIPQVMFGSKNCTEVKWNGTYMMARAPAGVGGPYDLVVLFDYLSYAPSAKTSNFSYGQPILLNVYPTKGPAVGFNITLEADKIGTPGVDQVTVTVGGKRCLEVIYEIANTIKCTCPPGINHQLGTGKI
ncbi:hypothetical protein BKA69DRAFT_834178 [Paraphysoderma sedebokerense]|nr:hypothetical protein BKA69DRAFT_834178 [Paraphysoderma sedebokerense]